MDNGGKINGADGAPVVGYNIRNREKPPEDDICPICFDDFNLPCKTTCGHWYCCSCFLQLWKYSRGKRCKCPICGCRVTKLVPEPSLLNHRCEDVGEVLKNVQQYNRLNAAGLISGVFLKALMVLLFFRMRLRETADERILRRIFLGMHLFGVVMGRFYDEYDLRFFPNGSLGILRMFHIFGGFLVLFLILDGVWYRLRRRLADLPPMVRND